ncbi:OPT oligopeptide transporter protein-domain-containing protein [Lipomyces japonicus]|uniref:OPT oligopeptide transporter protein-domain-containing protein n=1 Tax=Lipomyces japonicus TaxID=56871 RepID=UPI0034CDD14B
MATAINEHHSDSESDKNGTLLTEKKTSSLTVDITPNEIHDEHFVASDADIEKVIDKVLEISENDALDILVQALEHHADDQNFPNVTREKIRLLVQGREKYGKDEETYVFDLKTEACIIRYFSPYPEVRSITNPYEKDEEYLETFRVYVIATVWTIISAGMFQFFAARQPSISLTVTVLQLFIYPSGKLLEYVLPGWQFEFRNIKYSINPGPWTFKEQMLASIMVNVAGGPVYAAAYNIITQKSPQFFGQTWATVGYQFLLVLSTQFLGFGFAGVLRRWAVYPIKAVWPTVLPPIAISRALTSPEQRENIHGWTMSRYKFFFVVSTLSFLYFWFPNYIFQSLSYFNWITWIAPQNFNLATITGSLTGLGLNPITTFDWNYAQLIKPLVIPFYSFINQYVGHFISFIIIVAMYYSNYKWTSYLPVNSSILFDNTGDTYNIYQILGPDGLVNNARYQAYSPPYYSASVLLLYGAAFAAYPFTFIWTFLYEGRQILDGLKDFISDLRVWKSRPKLTDRFDDPFSKAISKYKEVPDYWFLILLVISFVLGVVCIEVYPTNTPVWALVVVILLNFIFLIPLTYVLATTGFSFGMSILSELIAGYAFPGNSTALMIIKAFGYNIDGQASTYISCQKMAHYTGISPRSIFRGQLAMTLVQSIVVIGVANWQLGNIENFCAYDNAQRFTCPQARISFSAAIVWGIIGPKRIFNNVYPILRWCFLIGALLPLPIFVASKYFKPLRLVNPVLIIVGMSNWAPYNLSYTTPALYLSVFFMYWVRRRFVSWWEKYNYVLSGAMDAGVAFSAVIIFFAVQYHDKPINWWGNLVFQSGTDAGLGQSSRLPIPEKGYFGLEPGSF